LSADASDLAEIVPVGESAAAILEAARAEAERRKLQVGAEPAPAGGLSKH
jgi:hypothetical protein